MINSGLPKSNKWFLGLKPVITVTTKNRVKKTSYDLGRFKKFFFSGYDIGQEGLVSFVSEDFL